MARSYPRFLKVMNTWVGSEGKVKVQGGQVEGLENCIPLL